MTARQYLQRIDEIDVLMNVNNIRLRYGSKDKTADELIKENTKLYKERMDIINGIKDCKFSRPEHKAVLLLKYAYSMTLHMVARKIHYSYDAVRHFHIKALKELEQALELNKK